MPSLGPEVTTVLPIEWAKERVVPAFLEDLVYLSGMPNYAEDYTCTTRSSKFKSQWNAVSSEEQNQYCCTQQQEGFQTEEWMNPVKWP